MKRILITLSFLAFFCSCTSNDDSQTEDLQTDNFYALTVGNSWEYRWYNFNPGTSEEPNPNELTSSTPVTESISIVGTEELNGNLYYKFKKVISGNDELGGISILPYSGEYFEYYRDSLGFLINSDGDIKFVNNSNEEFLMYEGNPQSDLHFGYGNLSENTVDFVTEAGSFECLEMLIKWVNQDVEAPAVNHHYFADGVGLIKDEIVFIANPYGSGYQRRLESYNVQ